MLFALNISSLGKICYFTGFQSLGLMTLGDIHLAVNYILLKNIHCNTSTSSRLFALVIPTEKQKKKKPRRSR